MKKVLFILCLLLALACIFAACNSEETPNTGTNGGTEQNGGDSSGGNNQGYDNQGGNNTHTHSYGEWSVTKAATCVAKGEEKRSCSCGESETREIAATGEHNYGEWSVSKAATCVAKGEEKRTCECGESETREIAATGEHTYDADDRCTVCHSTVPYTAGLAYYLNSDGNSYGVEKGTVTDSNIIIPSYYKGKPVTTVRSSAFRGCDFLISIVIPASITNIGSNAFYGCTSLTSINVPTNVSTIGRDAFNECKALKNVYITDLAAWCNIDFAENDSLAPLASSYYSNPLSNGANLYANETLITALEIPATVLQVAGGAFYRSNITSVTIPSSVLSIGEFAFLGCESLRAVYISDLTAWCNIDFGSSTANPLNRAEKLYLNNVLITHLEIPNSITQIKNYAFNSCTTITRVTIPASVTNIGEGAFVNCTALEGVYINDLAAWCSIEFDGITANPLYNDTNLYLSNALVTNLEIPDGITQIKNYAFYSYAAVASMVIPKSVTNIGEKSFYQCTMLTSVSLTEDNSLESIGKQAFKDCNSLTSITIPSNVKAIGDEAFANCTGLSEINFNAVEMNDLTFLDAVFFHAGQSAAGITVNIGADVTRIPAYLFSAYASGTSFINNAPCNIVNVVFAENSQLQSIGTGAFEGCKSLASINIPSSLIFVGKDAFWNCTSLNYTIYENGKYLGNDENPYTYLASVVDKSVTTFSIPNMTKIIGDCAFENCKELVSIILPPELSCIGAEAFASCTTITAIAIPRFVTKIGWAAFAGCINLRAVHITDLAAWCGIKFGSSTANPLHNDTNLYLNNTLVTNLEIPDSVTQIQDFAFYGCISIQNVTISNAVTSIDNEAFYGCEALQTIAIPPSVTSIGRNTFYKCEALKGVHITELAAWCNIEWVITDFANPYSNPLCYAKNLYLNNELVTHLIIPSTVTEIKNRTFEYWNGISVTIPASVTKIGDRAFDNCDFLTTVSFEDNSQLTSIGNFAFSSCNSLTAILFGENNQLTHIKQYAFSGCGSLRSITIPGNMTDIDRYAFENCYSLTSLTIAQGSQLKNIGEEAFYGCYKLIEIYNLSKTLTITAGKTWGGYIGYYAKSICTDETIPSKLFTDSNGYHFYDDGVNRYLLGYWGNEQNLVLPSNCHGETYEIYQYAFAYGELTSVTISDFVTKIGDKAFYNCRALQSITIPPSVREIGQDAFAYCSSLITIIFNATEMNDLYAYSGVFSSTGNDGTGITVTIGANVEKIPDYLFFCESREFGDIYFPPKIVNVSFAENSQCLSIGDYAFAQCTSLTSITIPASLNSIANTAFDGCSELTWNVYEKGRYLGNNENPYLYLGEVDGAIENYSVPNTTKLIGENAFSHCSLLKSIIIPDSVISIGAFAFTWCTSLTSITIPNSVTFIGEAAFYYCISLTSIEIPISVTSIGDRAFVHCSSLASITVEDGNTIYRSASNCLIETASKTLLFGCNTSVIPDDENVTSIAASAFYGCESLTAITIPNSVTSIGKRAFCDCTSLASVTIPSSVTSIGEYAFDNCSALTSITIPEGTTSIGNYAFNYCTSLKSVTFVETSGWSAGTTIPATDLADPAKTATYLKSTYRNYYWHRTVE